MSYVIGVDGGGTKTMSVVIKETLDPIGSGTAGPANARSLGAEVASANVASSIRLACEAAGIMLGDVDAICMCLSGFDTDLDLGGAF